MTTTTLSPTELRLLALHRSTALRLDDICETYLGISAVTARKHAALNTLPFPTFRASDSAKAPLLVEVRDLADHLDRAAASARDSWQNSQV